MALAMKLSVLNVKFSEPFNRREIRLLSASRLSAMAS